MRAPTHSASIGRAFLALAEARPEEPVFRYLDAEDSIETRTLAEVAEDATRRARSLAAELEPGSRVLLAYPHGYDLVVSFLGAILADTPPAVVPYYDPAAPDRSRTPVRFLAGRVDPAAVIGPADAVGPLRSDLEGTAIRVLAPRDEPDGSGLPRDLASADRTAYVQLSSGTTGPPRGIVLSHRAVLAYIRNSGDALRMAPWEGVMVGWLPLFHDMGLACHLLHPILRGMQSVHIPPHRWIRAPSTLFRVVSDHRGTMTWMPNFAFEYCARKVRDADLEGVDLSSWNAVGNGAEPVRRGTLQRFHERFGPYGYRPETMIVGYGLAENLAGVTFTPLEEIPREDWISQDALQERGEAVPVTPHSPGSRCVMSCGRPLRDVRIRIIDSEGVPLPDRRVGRIEIRSPSLFSGYLDELESGRGSGKTAPPLEPRTPEGWFRTGDLGYLADGELHVCDRVDDLIVVAGRNVVPHHVETIGREVIGDRAGRAAAFGVEDPSLGTRFPVFVCEMRRPPEASEARELAARVRHRVFHSLGVPLADVRLVAPGWLVRTTSGKTSRSASRDRYLREQEDAPDFETLSPELPERVLEERVGALAAAQTGGTLPDPVENLFDFGLDSLQLVSLLTEIEVRTGRSVDVEAFTEEPTVRTLVRWIRSTEAAPSLRRPEDPRPVASSSEPGADAPWIRRALDRGLPYGLGWRILTLWSRTPLARWIHRNRIDTVRRFLRAVGHPERDESRALRRSLTNQLSTAWRRRTFRRWPDRAERWVDVSGERILDEALEGGRGAILLLSHVVDPRLTVAALRRFGIDDPALVYRPEEEGRTARVLELLRGADHTLARGGVACIAGDGQVGASDPIRIAFLGRTREFYAGFAYLALRHRVPVLPVFSSCDPAGRVSVWIEPPIEPSTGESPDERSRDLVEAYADRLARQWEETPWDVPIGRVRRYLKAPETAVVEPV